MTWVSNTKRREGYYNKTSKDKPSELLIEALKYVNNVKAALDLGCGAGVEVKELAKRGYNTTAVDVNIEVRKYFSTEDLNNIELIVRPIEKFDFKKYDFIFAKNSLVFLSPSKFMTAIIKIKQSLNPDGVFAARLWGINDSDNNSGRNYKYTFVTTDRLKQLFKNYDFKILKDYEEDGMNAYGHMKHWHFIDMIVRKPIQEF